MKKFRLFILSLFTYALPSPNAFADLPTGTGDVAAQTLVDGISSVRTAMAEVKVRKPALNLASSSSGTSISAIPSSVSPKLPMSNNMEFTAGSDRLIRRSDVRKQASLFGEARYRLNGTLQVGGSLALRYQGNESARDMAVQALFGPTLNFGADHGAENAFFVSPKIGATASRTLDGDTRLGARARATASLSVGKRFALGRGIAYAPSVGAVKQVGMAPYFAVVPVAVSLFF